MEHCGLLFNTFTLAALTQKTVERETTTYCSRMNFNSSFMNLHQKTAKDWWKEVYLFQESLSEEDKMEQEKSLLPALVQKTAVCSRENYQNQIHKSRYVRLWDIETHVQQNTQGLEQKMGQKKEMLFQHACSGLAEVPAKRQSWKRLQVSKVLRWTAKKNRSTYGTLSNAHGVKETEAGNRDILLVCCLGFFLFFVDLYIFMLLNKKQLCFKIFCKAGAFCASAYSCMHKLKSSEYPHFWVWEYLCSSVNRDLIPELSTDSSEHTLNTRSG